MPLSGAFAGAARSSFARQPKALPAEAQRMKRKQYV
jgi:hypothetical protein